MSFQSAPGFAATCDFNSDQSDNPMCSYYADQATAHALRNPHDMMAQQKASYWQTMKTRQQMRLTGQMAPGPSGPAAPQQAAPAPPASSTAFPGLAAQQGAAQSPFAMPPLRAQMGASLPQSVSAAHHPGNPRE